ncbi:MAG: hypothetical protein E4H40_00335, partial [Candidatus Brocadiia bacterium]
MRKHIILTGLLLLYAFVMAIVVFNDLNVSKAKGADSATIGSDVSLLKVSEYGITLEFDPPGGGSGTLEAELYEMGDKLLAKVTRQHKGRSIEFELFAQINEKDLSNYYLRYRFNSSENFRRRSLLFVGEILETTVLGQREFVAGTRPIIRVMVRDKA